RILKRVAVPTHLPLRPRLPHRPLFLEPSAMPHLPQQGIHDPQFLSEELFVGPVLDHLHCPSSSVTHPRGEHHVPSHGIIGGGFVRSCHASPSDQGNRT